MGVHKKLQDARIKLQGMDLKKTGHNKFSGYYYFELGDFLPQTQQIFSDIGLCGTVSFTSELASITITDIEDGAQIILTSPMGTAALKGCHDIQNIGAVETYQRRYLWVTAMEIVEHDAIDIGGAAGQEQEPTTKRAQQPEKLADSDLHDVKLAMRECGDIEALQKVFGAAYKKASKAQQAELKKTYDSTKQELTGEPA